MRLKRTVASRRWTSLASSLVLFALLCATLAYWGLQLLAPPVAIAPSASLVDHRDAPDLATAARLFGQPVGGGTTAAPVSLSNIQVLGVAASAVRGSVVLVVDGKPARAYMVGDAVTESARLVEVRPDVAVIEQNGARVELVAPQRPSVAILSGGPVRNDSAAIARTPPVPTLAPPPAGVPAAPSMQPPDAGPRTNAPIGPPPGATPTGPAPSGAAPPQAAAQPESGSDAQAGDQAPAASDPQSAPQPGTDGGVLPGTRP
ncbi:MAG: hypothetical protein EHM83_09740 [Burkholderiales bacterium]|nr:MAG: hypothetical protein EHM83_09740 [Burkholderiales bacterium]